jgi:hypothetical protein
VIDAGVIAKIQKLRAMTEKRGATEQEAIAAQQAMFTLLAKHHLEISQMPDDEPTRPDTTSTRNPPSAHQACGSSFCTPPWHT